MHTDVAALGAASVRPTIKTAGAAQMLGTIGKGIGKMFGRGAKTVAKAAPSAVPSAPTANAALGAATNAGRSAATSLGSASANAAARSTPGALSRLGQAAKPIAAVGGAAVGAGHINNAVQEGRMDPFESYRKHTDAYQSMTQGLEQQIADASARGDMDQVQQLVQQMESGDYGASPFSFGGLNPFVEAGAGSHLNKMRDRRSEASNQYGDAVNAHAGKKTELLGEQNKKRQTINTQLAAVQARLQSPTLLPQQRQLYQSTLTNLQNALKQFDAQGQTDLSALGAESAEAARIKQQAAEAGMYGAGEAFPTPGQPAGPTPAASPAPATPATPATPASGVPGPYQPKTPPNGNPLLVGGASQAPLTPVNFRQVPVW